jgi:imidazolonepropionase-like amidohydrolase
MHRFVTTLFVLTLLPVWAPAQANPQTVVLMRARGIDGTGRAPIENAVVLIADGQIQVVGKNRAVAIPKHAREIDASGKTQLPPIEPSARIAQRST